MAEGAAFDEATARRLIKALIYVERLMRNDSPNSTQYPPTRDNFRRIRAQVVGNVLASDATFLVDNIEHLEAGYNPGRGDPSHQVRVKNSFGQAYSDNASVDAVYKAFAHASPEAHWVTTPSGGVDRYVAANDAFGAVVADAVPATLKDKLFFQDTYNELIHLPIYADVEVSDTPNHKVRLFQYRDGVTSPPGTGPTDFSQLYICTLAGDLAGTNDITAPNSVNGQVFSISGPGCVTTVLGSRSIFSHYEYDLPDNGRYYCMKTYTDPASADDDEFTVVSADVPRLLLSLPGAAEFKALRIGEGGGLANLGWGGQVCNPGTGS